MSVRFAYWVIFPAETISCDCWRTCCSSDSRPALTRPTISAESRSSKATVRAWVPKNTPTIMPSIVSATQISCFFLTMSLAYTTNSDVYQHPYDFPDNLLIYLMHREFITEKLLKLTP